MTKIQKMNEHSWSRSSWDPANVVRCFKCGIKKEKDTPAECSVAKQQASTKDQKPTGDLTHCWCSEHTYGRPSESIIYTCCWCGKEQSVKGERKEIPFNEGHGPHGPTYDEVEAPEPPPEICPARV